MRDTNLFSGGFELYSVPQKWCYNVYKYGVSSG